MNADYVEWARSYLDRELRKARELGMQQRLLRIEYMLDQNVELDSVYRELTCKLKDVGHRERVLAAALDIAAAWSPTKVAETRKAAKRLEDLNRDIATTAMKLHELLEKSTSYANRFGIDPGAGYSTLEVAQVGAKLLDHEVDELLEVRMPALLDIVKGIAQSANMAKVRAADNVTAAAFESREPSSRDAIRAFWARLGNSTDNGGRCDAWRLIPAGFQLSDTSTASLLNCVLRLVGEPSEITAENVRKTRKA